MKLKKILLKKLINKILKRPKEEVMEKVVAPYPGVLLFNKQLGDMVRKDEIVARIFDPKSITFSLLKAPSSGQIVYQRLTSVIEEQDLDNSAVYILLKHPEQ